MGKIILTFFLAFACTSCRNTFYGIDPISAHCPPRTDSSIIGPNVRIVNIGKVGCSSIRFKTSNGNITVCGIKPGDTSSYFKLYPFCTGMHHAISVMQLYGWANGKATSFLEGYSIYHSCQDVDSGTYSFVVDIKRNRKKLQLIKAEFIEETK